MDEEFAPRTAALADHLLQRGQSLACAESCTGGWLAKVCTDRAGSSAWFDRGVVSYTDQSKQELLGVSAATLDRFGAVSEQTVREMATGIVARSAAQWGVAISGIAGPGGGSPEKPVGTVWLAWAGPDEWLVARRCSFQGDREGIRRQAVAAALDGLLERLDAEAR